MSLPLTTSLYNRDLAISTLKRVKKQLDALGEKLFNRHGNPLDKELFNQRTNFFISGGLIPIMFHNMVREETDIDIWIKKPSKELEELVHNIASVAALPSYDPDGNPIYTIKEKYVSAHAYNIVLTENKKTN